MSRKKAHRVGFIAGDGIGPEVAWAARRCAEATGVEIAWEDVDLGRDVLIRTGQPVPARTAQRLLEIGRVLKAPMDGGFDGSARNPNGVLRALFDVHASVRHCRWSEGLPGSAEGLDVVVVRQETADRSSYREVSQGDEEWKDLARVGGTEAAAAALRFVNVDRARRFFETAFSLAMSMGRRKVTIAHKANLFRKTDGLWLDCAGEVARRFPSLEVDDQLVDHVVLQMTRSPRRYDVVAVGELYGDVVGDLGVGLAGGLGMVPQVLYGTRGTIFTSVHGTAPKYARLDRVNPSAMILAAVALLQEMDEKRAAGRMENGLWGVLRAGQGTADLCAAERCREVMGTKVFAQSVADWIQTRAREKGRPSAS